MNPLVIDGPTPGGLLTQTHSVQNWPGEMDIDGTALTDKIKDQVVTNGARLVSEEVIRADFSIRPFRLTLRALDGSKKTRQIDAESCIIAMGTTPNFLRIPGEQTYWGKGVSNCAICDGTLYKGEVVGVVGGGDAAVVEALYLSNIAKEVHVFVRKSGLKAIEETRVDLLRKTPNVHFHFDTTVLEVKGDGQSVKGVILKKKSTKEAFSLSGLFLAIGSTPNSKIFQKTLQLDSQGYIVLHKDQETSVKGVYAVGDIVDPVYKQAITAAGEGARAAMQSEQYLSTRMKKYAAQNEEILEKTVVSVSPKVIEISSVKQFNSEIETSEVPIFVDFYATWCGPCKRVSPVIDSAAKSLVGRVKFLKVDVDRLQELSSKYEIKAMPTVILFDPSGTEIDRRVGQGPITSLIDTLKEN